MNTGVSAADYENKHPPRSHDSMRTQIQLKGTVRQTHYLLGPHADGTSGETFLELRSTKTALQLSPKQLKWMF